MRMSPNPLGAGWQCLLLLAGVCLCLCLGSTSSSSSFLLFADAAHLQVQMRAGWNSTSLALEASEYFTSPPQYYEFIQRINGKLSATSSDQEQYDAALSVAGDMLGSASAQVFRSALVLRTASPAVETLRNMRENRIASAVADIPYDNDKSQDIKDASALQWGQCSNLIAVGGAVFCGLEELDWTRLDAAVQEGVYDFDRIHPASSMASHSPLILYADPLSTTFRATHDAIVARLARTSFKYVLRPVIVSSKNAPKRSNQDSLFVQGFGIELAIKNMEYKVLDDSKIEYDSDKNSNVELPDEMLGGAHEDEQDINGFFFKKLSERRPELATELEDFRAALLKSHTGDDSADKKVNVWDMKDLGFQSAQRILQAKQPLEVLRDLSQNFPMYAQALTRTKLNTTVKASLVYNTGKGLPAAGTNFMDINGLSIDLSNNADELDIYTIISLLKTEARTIDELNQLSLTTPSLQQVLNLNLGSKIEAELAMQQQGGQPDANSAFLLNMDVYSTETKRILTWLNDIQNDARYRSWPASLQELLAPAWPNQLRYVRKNIITGILIADPANSKGLEYLTQAKFFVNANAPIRLGFTFYIPSAVELQAKAALKAAEKNKKNKKNASSSKRSSIAWNNDILAKSSSSDWEALFEDEEEDQAASSVDVYNSIQAKIAKAYYYIVLNGAGSRVQNKESAFELLQNLFDQNNKRTKPVTYTELEKAYNVAAKKANIASGAKALSLEKIFDLSDLNELVQLNIDYVASRAFATEIDEGDGVGQMPILVTNGAVHVCPAPEVSFRELMMNAIYPEQQKIVAKVYFGELNDRMDIHKHLQSKSNVQSRMNPAITSLVANMKFVPTLPNMDQALSFRYYTSPADTEDGAEAPIASLSYWLVVDLTKEADLHVVASALEYLKKGHGDLKSRIAIFQNPASQIVDQDYKVGKLVSLLTHSTNSALTTERRFELMQQLIQVARYFYHDNAKLAKALQIWINSHKELSNELNAALSQTNAQLNGGKGLNADIAASYLQSFVSAGQSVLVLNGRIIALDAPGMQKALSISSGSIVSDFKLASGFTFNNFQHQSLLATIQKRLEFSKVAAGAKNTWLSEVLFRISYVMIKRSSSGTKTASQPFPHYDPENHNGMIRLEQPNSLIRIRVALDPLSKTAQKISPLLAVLRDMFDPSLLIWLTPKSGVTEFPIKRFYRYAVGSSLQFEEGTGAVKAFSGALFRNLRTKHILSTVIFTPESWTVALEKSKYDLDNLNVMEMPEGASVTHVQYEIENLLMFGQCLDQTKREPPAGLQLMIGSSAIPFAGDTVVMQNLGYFQLKANPGEWTLSIADQRHSDIYHILPAAAQDGNDEHEEEDEEDEISIYGQKRSTRHLFVRSFTEGFLQLNVRRNYGEENTPLLDPKNKGKKGSSGGGSIWSSVFGGGEDKPLASVHGNRTGEVIHIFSLASGHLYERFLKIMMQSVISTTKNPVKFWFIKNFASPQFVEFVPFMAKQMGFEAEFVTYKWPVWLRRQEEKQRIIWGYKILFLDVLFPLAVPRVIYIDADQVVRGDVKELWNLDLKGAPYAYTPFCDSNKDTEGFRFWKQGYWKDHLKGKPYHISALYVVDLDQFRLMRAGDSLRGIYDQLSADPGSLANLDQDLPNYAQSMVPIYSLPQEWLWCQTWCSMETLPEAKTVDLCNNPLTKTPKLDVAKALLPEWIPLDQNAKSIEVVFQTQKSTGTTASTSTSTQGTAAAGGAKPHDEL